MNFLFRMLFYLFFFVWVAYITIMGEWHWIEGAIAFIGFLYFIWAILWEMEQYKLKGVIV